MEVIGHDAVKAALEKNLPRVTLLRGTPSIGKWTLAEHLRQTHGFTGLDVARVHLLNADRARELVEFAWRASLSERKLAIIRLDKSNDRAQTILLKALEDSQTYFILVASNTTVLPTITSRAETFQLSTLSRTDLAAVLQLRSNLNDAEAARLAKIGNGSVKRALTVFDGQLNKSKAVRALAAIHDHDPAGLEELAPKWTDEDTELLRTWARESITGRWSVFLPEESQFNGISFPLRLLGALRAEVRPKLAVRAALMSLI